MRKKHRFLGIRKYHQTARLRRKGFTMKLVYITPCKHHILLEDGNQKQVGLISVTHVSDKGNHFVLNGTYEVTKKSVEAKEMSTHFTFLANFCSLQDSQA